MLVSPDFSCRFDMRGSPSEFSQGETPMLNFLTDRARPISTAGSRAAARRCAIGLISAVILAVVAASWLTTAASARGMGGGSGGGRSFGHSRGSPSFGRFHSGPRFSRFDKFGFIRDRRFHESINGGFFNGNRRFNNGFNGGFFDSSFPFGGWGGWGWGDFGGPFQGTQPIQPVITGDPAPAPRPQRYEPPTVETTPEGVTIVRGPGSRHF